MSVRTRLAVLFAVLTVLVALAGCRNYATADGIVLSVDEATGDWVLIDFANRVFGYTNDDPVCDYRYTSSSAYITYSGPIWDEQTQTSVNGRFYCRENLRKGTADVIVQRGRSTRMYHFVAE